MKVIEISIHYCNSGIAMIGTIIVQEAHAAEEVKEEVTQLTINSLEIYENRLY